MQQDIDNLVMQSKVWELPFNASKCKTLHLGRTNPNHVYTMAGCGINQTSEEKDLGVNVTTDDKLKFH